MSNMKIIIIIKRLQNSSDKSYAHSIHLIKKDLLLITKMIILHSMYHGKYQLGARFQKGALLKYPIHADLVCEPSMNLST